MTGAEVDAKVVAFLQARGVTEARHFTTSRGLLGILTTRLLLSRARRETEELIELVSMNNCYRRWDDAWFDYVNLSVQRINGHLYGISSGRWHIGEDLWWTVLGFDRDILAHEGVVFTTTNNGYTVVERAPGLSGLSAMFGETVRTWKGGPAMLHRRALPDNQPTDPQAEALYPRAVSTEHLRTIYVPKPELADTVYGWIETTGHPQVEVLFDPEAFA